MSPEIKTEGLIKKPFDQRQFEDYPFRITINELYQDIFDIPKIFSSSGSYSFQKVSFMGTRSHSKSSPYPTSYLLAEGDVYLGNNFLGRSNLVNAANLPLYLPKYDHLEKFFHEKGLFQNNIGEIVNLLVMPVSKALFEWINTIRQYEVDRTVASLGVPRKIYIHVGSKDERIVEVGLLNPALFPRKGDLEIFVSPYVIEGESTRHDRADAAYRAWKGENPVVAKRSKIHRTPLPRVNLRRDDVKITEELKSTQLEDLFGLLKEHFLKNPFIAPDYNPYLLHQNPHLTRQG